MKRFLAAALILTPSVALAHPGHGFGFDSGVLHPFSGADHLLAMVGVGVWAAQQVRGRWALPLTFVTAMAAGFGLGLPLPVEPMILASVVLLGLAVTLALRAPLAVTLPLVAVMGLAHGTAHGAEGSGMGFALGMIAATAALHAIGAALGLTLNRAALRVTGAVTLLAGLGLVVGG